MPDQDLLEALKLDQDPGYEYGGLFPIKWPQGASGWSGMAGIRPAIPGFVRDQYNGLLSLAQDAGGAFRPGDNIDPEKLLSLAGTGAIAGTMVPKNALGMFAGRMSKVADTDALKEAALASRGQLSPAETGKYAALLRQTNNLPRGEALSAEDQAAFMALHDKKFGNTPEQINATRNPIFDTTGWFKGRDGKWRYEISDDEAKLGAKFPNEPNQFSAEKEPRYSLPYNFGGDPKKNFVLRDVLDHPELYEAYPHLQGLPVKPVPLGSISDTKGAYDPVNKQFYLGSGSAEDVKSTLLHEVQHAIQDHEGFAPGANTNMFLPEGFKDKAQYAETVFSDTKDKLRDKGINPLTAADVIKKLGSGETLKGHEAEAYTKLKESGLLAEWQEAYRQYEPVRIAQKAATDQYYATHGEAEARNTEYRSGMTPFMRAQEKPWDTLQWMDHPVAEDKLIVLGQDGQPRLAQQVKHDPFKGERSTQGKDLASQGRLGDSLVGHLTPGDAVIPAEIQNNPRVKELLQEIYSLTGTNPDRFTAGHKGNKLNPKTGLPEFEDAGGDGGGGGDAGGSDAGGAGGDAGAGSAAAGADAAGGSAGNDAGGAAGDAGAGSAAGSPSGGAAGTGQGGPGPGGGEGGSFQPSAATGVGPRPAQILAAGPKPGLPSTILTPVPTGLQPSAASPTSMPGTDLLNRLLQIAGSPAAQTNNFASQLNDLLKLQSGIYAPGG